MRQGELTRSGKTCARTDRRSPWGKRIFAALLALAMVVVLLPTVALADAGIQDGIPTLTVNSSTVAFDGREWWVIGDGTTGVHPVANHITLLAKDSIGAAVFRSGGSTQTDPNWKRYGVVGWYYAPNPTNLTAWREPSEYAGSTLQQQMETLAGGIGNADEKALIEPRDLTTSDGISNQGISAQKYWALSYAEYGTINNTTVLSNSAEWWLRSSFDALGVLCVAGNGRDSSSPVTFRDGVRPAFNLDLSSVLFTSAAAAGGKFTATAGNGFIDATAPTGTVKFTAQAAAADARNNFTASTTARSGNDLTISYENATVGTNDYVSAVIKRSGAVTHYAKLVKPTNATGTTTLTLPTGFDAVTDTVYVFSEQANGDLHTDFASALRQVALTVGAAPGGDVGTDIPKTGDGSMPYLWAGLALLAGTGLVVLRRMRRAQKIRTLSK